MWRCSFSSSAASIFFYVTALSNSTRESHSCRHCFVHGSITFFQSSHSFVNSNLAMAIAKAAKRTSLWLSITRITTFCVQHWKAGIQGLGTRLDSIRCGPGWGSKLMHMCAIEFDVQQGEVTTYCLSFSVCDTWWSSFFPYLVCCYWKNAEQQLKSNPFITGAVENFHNIMPVDEWHP